MKQIALHSPWSLESFRCEFDIKLWILWSVRNGFVHIWRDMSSEPTGAMVVRPVSFSMVYEHGPVRVAREIFWFDTDGEIAWVDFCWAPGQKNEVLKRLVRHKERIWIAWQRHNKPEVHMIKIGPIINE